MKQILIVLFVIFSISVQGQDNFIPKTGDGELDDVLKHLNINAQADIEVFKKDLSVGFNVAEGKLTNLMVSYGMQPADLYMACEVSQQTGKTIEQVAECYKTNQGKGWGVIAKQMGIKPGSPAFHALKDHAKGKNNAMKEKHGNGHGNNGGNGHGNGKGHGKGHGHK